MVRLGGSVGRSEIQRCQRRCDAIWVLLRGTTTLRTWRGRLVRRGEARACGCAALYTLYTCGVVCVRSSGWPRPFAARPVHNSPARRAGRGAAEGGAPLDDLKTSTRIELHAVRGRGHAHIVAAVGGGAVAARAREGAAAGAVPPAHVRAPARGGASRGLLVRAAGAAALRAMHAPLRSNALLWP